MTVWFKRHWHLAVYSGLALLTALAYLPARTIMIDQSPVITVTASTITLNMILLYFIAGYTVDKATKNRSRMFGWVMLGIVLVVLTLFFRFVGGYETIFG